MNIPNRQANTRLVALFGIFAVIVIGLLWWIFALVPKIAVKNSTVNQACTTDAKVCPDGSAVSRTGSNCEFADCPNNNINARMTSDCLVTGCSRQVCAETEVTTTCEMKPEYACYASATCTRQANGSCGWTMTTGLRDCLARFARP